MMKPRPKPKKKMSPEAKALYWILGAIVMVLAAFGFDIPIHIMEMFQ